MVSFLLQRKCTLKATSLIDLHCKAFSQTSGIVDFPSIWCCKEATLLLHKTHAFPQFSWHHTILAFPSLFHLHASHSFLSVFLSPNLLFLPPPTLLFRNLFAPYFLAPSPRTPESNLYSTLALAPPSGLTSPPASWNPPWGCPPVPFI